MSGDDLYMDAHLLNDEPSREFQAGMKPARKHNHYFKDVNNLTEVDVYRVCQLFNVDDPSGAIQHAIKKLLLPGQRGAGKNRRKDIQEAIDTLKRRLEMMDEDGEVPPT